VFKSLLIANRGEIACRIIRTARAMGLRTIAVFSEADADAPFVRQADDSRLIGPAPARDSYLAIEKIIAAAQEAGAEAIHPGYGFLAERAEFAEACAAADIVFVGPPPSAIRAMGLKDAAKALVEKAGVPVVPGYHGERQELDFLRQQADAVGYPVLIKAVAGGGGKGMKRVDKAAEFEASLASAKREAKGAFGDERVLVEMYVEAPRHVEMQVFADRHGNVVHLFERDCSLQRRHQKVIEEAPAPGMTAEVRAAMGKAATEAARAVGYEGAGTVEFIADGRGGLKADRFYFMEMNTRLQVEHPVTEAITGLDLVELQLRVAAGEKLPFTQADIKPKGHAVEARVYAEDPEKRFLPSTGKLFALKFPSADGIRIDTGVEEGGEVTPYYDPMIAKVIAYAPTRVAALDKLAAALGGTLVAGPKTNVAFLKKLCEAPSFRAGVFDTGFIDQNLEALGAVARPVDAEAVRLGALALVNDLWAAHFEGRDPTRPDAASPWDNFDAFQLGPARRQALKLVVDNKPQAVVLVWGEPAARFEGIGLAALFGGGRTTYARFLREDRRQFVRAGGRLIVLRDGRQTSILVENPFPADIERLDDAGGVVTSPMHGKLIQLLVKPGDKVKKGERVAVVEAMKMEHALLAPQDGTVSEIAAEAGAQVKEGARLMVIG
jgi:3-methylcrotonyl-CoA carboxylase alpha subunit